MLKKICIYNCKIFLTCDIYLVAYSYNKYSESQDEHFKECLKLKMPIKCTYVNEVALEVLNHHITGTKSLLVLVFDSIRLCHAFIYCDSFGKKLYEIVLPIGPVAIEDYCTRMFVSDGPTFLFHSNDLIHLFSAPRRKNNAFDSLLVSSGSKEYKILQFKCFGPLGAVGSLRFLSLLIISYDFSTRQRIKIAGFVSDYQNPAVNYELLSLHLFFPQCYETVLKAVEVIKLLPCFETHSVSLKDVKFKEITCVTCTKDECLVFFNAALLYCCKLTEPLSRVMCIQSEISSFSTENIHLVLTLENKAVFFISIKDGIACEVCRNFTDIETALMGDILRKGSKQVLLLKKTDFETWQNSCILYDILSFIPVDLFCRNTMPDECLKATITGLKRKVLVDKSVYKEVEHEISQKSAAVIDALIKLNDFKVNSELLKQSHIFQESLVDLILSKDENKIRGISPEAESSVKLLEKKENFVNNHYVINLFFKNEGEKCICNPGIKVLMKGSQVTSTQKLFVHSTDNFSFCDKYSLQIHPKGRFTILLSFEFSACLVGDMTLILTWYEGSTDEFDNEIFIKENQKILVQHQSCLQTKITLSDVMNYEINTDISSPSDILFLRVSQQRTKLCISSLYSSIKRLEDLLTNCDLHVFQSSSSKCIVFSNEKSHLLGAHIVILNAEQYVVEIEAYTENETEILLLIQYLYMHLPEDVIISPQLNFKNELSQFKKDAANSMKNELDLLVSSLSIHNISEEMRKNYSKLLSSQMAGTITIPKSIYNRIRTALVKKEYMTDSIFKCFNNNYKSLNSS